MAAKNSNMQTNTKAKAVLRMLFLFIFIFAKQGVFAQKVQYGKASYYGDKFEGRTTANGEIFRKAKLTAAHNKLPFNTFVKVTNLRTQKSIIVRINDRGPFKDQRILDLSEAAAQKIGMGFQLLIFGQNQLFLDMRIREVSRLPKHSR